MKRLAAGVIALMILAVPALALNAHQGHLKDRLDTTRHDAGVARVTSSQCLTDVAQKHANAAMKARKGIPFHHLTYKIRKACGTKGPIHKTWVSVFGQRTTYDGCYNAIYRSANDLLVDTTVKKVGIGAQSKGPHRTCVFVFKGHG